jgi:hypothetical protein
MSIFLALQSETAGHSWPLVNFTNLDTISQREISRSAYDGIGVMTLMNESERALFIGYESGNCESRLTDGHMKVYGSTDFFVPGTAGTGTGLKIFSTEGLTTSSIGDNYAIISYRFPPPSTCQAQTVNFKSGAAMGPLLNATVTQGATLNSAIQPFDAVVAGYYPDAFAKERHSQVDHPRSYTVTPVHASLDNLQSETVAIVFANVAYDLPLKHLKQSMDGAVDVVFHNTCEQSFTYRLEGEDVAFVGMSDVHSNKYDDMMVSFPINPEESRALLLESSHCRYSLVSIVLCLY